MTGLSLEKFDSSTETFIKSDAQVITWDDLLSKNVWTEPIDSSIFVVAIMYDIPRTMIAALRNLKKQCDNPYAAVFNSPRHLKEVVEARTGVNLMAVSNFVPSEVVDKPAWQIDFTRQALVAGCAGAIVSFNCVDLAQEYPDRQFFRYW